MASLFGHIAVSTALGHGLFPQQVRPATLVVAGFCAFAPDLDVLTFYAGIPYSSEWGHRGWTHSLVFALIWGAAVGWLAQKFVPQSANSTQNNQSLLLWCILSTASHPILDMMTNGGRGCALWWPFSVERLFLPWRPIQVSPMSVTDFFSPWGLQVLASEVLWIGFPCVFLVLLARLLRSTSKTN